MRKKTLIIAKIFIILNTILLSIVFLDISSGAVKAQNINDLPKVKKVKVIKTYSDKIKLSWKKIKRAKYYQIKVLKKTESGFKKIKTVKTKKNIKTKTVEKLIPNKTYYFRVRARTKKMRGQWSKRIKGKTKEEIIETPVFELPVNNIDIVSGIQVFHDPQSTTQLHTGFDFKLLNQTQIFAPISGEVTDKTKFQMSNGLWIIDVFIKFNSKYNTFIAFEPCTYEESIIDQQMTKINVNKGDTVLQGQVLGTLDPVADSEFPHIHWQVQKDSEPVSPYEYASTNAKAQMDILCVRYNKSCR